MVNIKKVLLKCNAFFCTYFIRIFVLVKIERKN